MKTAFYLKLATDGIKKNRKLYLPYILSCIGMVMMYYIVNSTAMSPLVASTGGGRQLQSLLGFGKFIVAVFALIFLLYTNSFLVKRRYKEFGLFNILGMDKSAISRVVFWESLIVSAIGLAGGMGLGIAFSKLAELGLLRTVKAQIDYRFIIPGEALIYTVELFGAIFALLMLKTVIQVRCLRPIDLLQSTSAGEKPLRANWFFAVIGVILLGAAYWISITIESPLTAIFMFFIAVVMVIIGTYLLFISASVAICKLLRANKKYYYKKEHFVSVSSMAYRMKRNGAGLASICILATMVLVMISSTSSLYFGADDAMNSRYPCDCEINLSIGGVSNITEENIGYIRNLYEQKFDEYKVKPEKVTEYCYAKVSGCIKDDKAYIDPNHQSELGIYYDNYLRNLYFADLADYNAYAGTSYTLNEGEILLYSQTNEIKGDIFTIEEEQFKIKEKIDNYCAIGDIGADVVPTTFIVVKDYSALLPIESYKYDDLTMLVTRYYYGYDMSCDSETAIEVFKQQLYSLTDGDHFFREEHTGSFDYSSGCKFLEKDDFYSTFGGLFFLGIILSAVFIFAASMIIYYKQISEGYEDAQRFDIMKKVGMTDKDIKKSINSQILTVFYAPLILAGIHLTCAFPIMWKLLQLFHLENVGVVIATTAIAFVIFGLFYALIYKITARAYYSIVKGK